MTESQHITLRELQRRVKSALEGQFALPLWVSAEISEIKVNYSAASPCMKASNRVSSKR